MTTNAAPLKGVIHGNTIELAESPGLPDGQEVSVVLHSVAREEGLGPGEGLRRAFGGWADDAEELDRYLEWNRQQRRIGDRDTDAEIEP
jgi:hypothetical protein